MMIDVTRYVIQIGIRDCLSIASDKKIEILLIAPHLIVAQTKSGAPHRVRRFRVLLAGLASTNRIMNVHLRHRTGHLNPH